MASEKCYLCKMMVGNIKVQMKLNHKKKYYGFKGQSMLVKESSVTLADDEKLSLPNYSRRAECLNCKAEQIKRLKKSKPVEENISHKLSMISGHVKTFKMGLLAAETEYFNIK